MSDFVLRNLHTLSFYVIQRKGQNDMAWLTTPRIAYGPHPDTQFIDLYLPRPTSNTPATLHATKPIVIVFHVYSLDPLSSTCKAIADALPAAALSVEYRRIGATSLGNYQTTTQDATDAVSFILHDKAGWAAKHALDLNTTAMWWVPGV
ncbi:hypothetical protein SeLEV6574_g02574 [Synchytrium endobioticum]|uniref:Uncharacterized protein n=1 Tax=Synchytrium endobioticum TaxID=286115 RepID=A0A507D8A7_9FUNG|nr:hypothetical protein SeLEV6574_g02574 [Synchytrium endobioticum]